jgi:NTE family protein
MMALRQVADPGSGEGAAWAGMRIHRARNDELAAPGYRQLNASGLPPCCGQGRAAAEDFLRAW